MVASVKLRWYDFRLHTFKQAEAFFTCLWPTSTRLSPRSQSPSGTVSTACLGSHEGPDNNISMLCDICKQALEGLWGPSRYGRVTEVQSRRRPLPPRHWLGDWRNGPFPELQNYVYKHHSTKASFRASQQDGCTICYAIGYFDDAPDEVDDMAGPGYYSLLWVYTRSASPELVLDIQYGHKCDSVGLEACTQRSCKSHFTLQQFLQAASFGIHGSQTIGRL